MRDIENGRVRGGQGEKENMGQEADKGYFEARSSK